MLRELIEEFVVWLRRERLASESTLDTWRPALRLFGDWVKQDAKTEPTLAHFTKDRILDFRLYLITGRDCRPRSVRRYLSALRSFNTWLIEVKHLLTESVAHQVKVGKLDAAIRPQVTDEEVLLMLDAASRIDDPIDRLLARAFLSVFAYAGLRRGECFNLKLRDIAPDGKIQVDKGKGGKNRAVYPSPECIAAINDWLKVRPPAEHPFLFAINRRHRMSHNTLNKLLRQCRRIAGLNDPDDAFRLKPHPMRRNNGQFLLKNGYSIDDVREHYGHSDIRTTQDYLMVTEERLKELRNKGNRQAASTPPEDPAPPTVPPASLSFAPTMPAMSPELMQQALASFPFFAAMMATLTIPPKPEPPASE